VSPKRPIPTLTFRRIADGLAKGQVVPIIGSYASNSGRGLDSSRAPTAGEFLPSGVEISQLLAEELEEVRSGLEHENLEEVATYYEDKFDRDRLMDQLYQYLGPEALEHAKIPPLFSFLASIDTPLLVITTNYDTLIERAFRANNKLYDLVTYPPTNTDYANAVLWWPHGESAPQVSASNDLDVDPSRTSVIFKMHGSLSLDEIENGVVVTEMDFIKLLSKIDSSQAIPALLASHCWDRSLLFLGYRLEDWNYRSILLNLDEKLRSDGSRPTSWAVSSDFSELEKAFWQNHKVQTLEITLDELVAELLGSKKQ